MGGYAVAALREQRERELWRRNLSRGLVLVEDVLFLGGGGGWRVGGIWGVAVMEEGVLGGMMGGGWMGWDRELWVLVYENGGTSGEESRRMGLLT